MVRHFYSKKIAEKITGLMAEGFNFNEISALEEMPCRKTLFNWINNNPEFKEMYYAAKEQYAEVIFDQIIQISDDDSDDWIEIESNGQIEKKPNYIALQRAKMKIDSRKYILPRIMPKYGDRTRLVGVDEDGNDSSLGTNIKVIHDFIEPDNDSNKNKE